MSKLSTEEILRRYHELKVTHETISHTDLSLPQLLLYFEDMIQFSRDAGFNVDATIDILCNHWANVMGRRGGRALRITLRKLAAL